MTLRPFRASRWKKQHALERVAVLLLGVTVGGNAVLKLHSGRFFYTNYLSQEMASVLALAVGILLVAVGTVWPHSSE